MPGSSGNALGYLVGPEYKEQFVVAGTPSDVGQGGPMESVLTTRYPASGTSATRQSTG